MKSILVKEALNFNRTGSPIDKMNIGRGPEKYVGIFEKILQLSDIGFHKSGIWEYDGQLNWTLDLGGSYWEVVLVDKDTYQNPNHRGWRLVEMSRVNYQNDPFDILKGLINAKWKNLSKDMKETSEHIEESKNHLEYLEKVATKIEEAKELIENKTII
jgi:hypothetical protein